MADADTSGITNPKRVIEKREAAASDSKAGRDMGDLPGPAADFFKGSGMSQADFSKYSKGGKKTPPAEMMKKRESKE